MKTDAVEISKQSLIEAEGSDSDFVKEYVEYADVLEAPSEAHEAIAIVLLSSVLNRAVHIEYGALRHSLDLCEESGRRRTRFRSEAEHHSVVIPNSIPV